MSTTIAQNTVTSHDGTSIAYSQIGQGLALILVDGALCYRDFGPSKALAALLSSHFTVVTYDRRGRGETWGPLLVGVYGLGLIGAGFFTADPAFGFPPGTAADPTRSVGMACCTLSLLASDFFR